jgi:hypothetical protein
MAKMGDWRNNKDEEIALDGIGGVSILVKADVHRSGMSTIPRCCKPVTNMFQASTSPLTRSRTKLRQRALRRWRSGLAIKWSDSRIMSSGISTQTRSLEMLHRDAIELFSPQTPPMARNPRNRRTKAPARRKCCNGPRPSSSK